MGRKQEEKVWIEYLSVRPDRVCKYARLQKVTEEEEEKSSNVSTAKANEARLEISEKILSDKAGKRLKDTINILLACSRPKKLYSKSLDAYFNFKVNFITLTLPSAQVHTDKEIHNVVFKDFIRTWKRKNPHLLYVWKAETQDNGRIHYHVTTNSFLHHKLVRKFWNRALNSLGYIDRCKVTDPNSTDVHAVKKVNNLGGYLATYMNKKDNYKKWYRVAVKDKKLKLITGTAPPFFMVLKHNSILKRKVNIKVWDASKELLLKVWNVELAWKDEIWDKWDLYRTHPNNASLILQEAEKVKYFDYCTVAYGNFVKPASKNPILKSYWYHLKSLSEISAQAFHMDEEEKMLEGTEAVAALKKQKAKKKEIHLQQVFSNN